MVKVGGFHDPGPAGFPGNHGGFTYYRLSLPPCLQGSYINTLPYISNISAPIPLKVYSNSLISRFKHSTISKMPPKKQHSNAKSKAPPDVSPNWPVFKPLLPLSDIHLETVVDSQIVVARNFWTGTLCKNYVAFLKSLPLTTTPGKPKKGEALRVNDRFQVMDEGFANRLWVETGLRELICGREEGEQEEDGMSAEQRLELWYVCYILRLQFSCANVFPGVGNLSD
jgi:hypothetical protein